MLTSEAFTIIVLVVALAMVVCLATYYFTYKYTEHILNMVKQGAQMMKEANLDREDMRHELRQYMAIAKQSEQKVLGLSEQMADSEIAHQKEMSELRARYDEVSRMLAKRR